MPNMTPFKDQSSIELNEQTSVYTLFHISWTTFSFNRSHLGMVSPYVICLLLLLSLRYNVRDLMITQLRYLMPCMTPFKEQGSH